MKTICSIYKITNKINGKLYIGQTWGPIKYRFQKHCHDCGCVKLHSAICKYGRDNFSIEIIDQADNQKLADWLETVYIECFDTVNNGYNLFSGGGGHKQHSQETKDKISKSKKGKPSNRKGSTHSDSAKALMSKSRKGRPWTEARRNAYEKRKSI